MEIKKRLQLSLHPLEYENNSMCNANNIMLSENNNVITNEYSLVPLPIFNKLNDDYSNVKIIYGFGCSDEVVYILEVTNKSGIDTYNIIIRVKDGYDEYKICATKYVYNGGELNCTYTYNVNNELIVAIAEDTSKQLIQTPLKVINLGDYNDSYSPDYYTDDVFLSIVPKVDVPKGSYEIGNGKMYKGWLKTFIRFKINDYDYTQWYSFGNTIYVDKPITKEIFSYGNSIYADCYENVSDELDICDKSILINTTYNYDNYKYFQLGVIVDSNTYSKKLITSDIEKTDKFELTLSNMIEYQSNDFYDTFNNYYNVKNIINYNNRLYISNYESYKFDPPTIKPVLNLKSEKININTIGSPNKLDNQRIKSLIPSGIYNFYIHYINDYGEISNGYKIDNVNRLRLSDDGTEFIYPIVVENVGVRTVYFAAFNESFTYNDLQSNRAYALYSNVDKGVVSNFVSDTSIRSNVHNILVNKLTDYIASNDIDTPLCKLLNNAISSSDYDNTDESFFGEYFNDKTLFRIPDYDFKSINELNVYTFDVLFGITDKMKCFISYEKFEQNIEYGLSYSASNAISDNISNIKTNISTNNSLDFNTIEFKYLGSSSKPLLEQDKDNILLLNYDWVGFTDFDNNKFNESIDIITPKVYNNIPYLSTRIIDNVKYFNKDSKSIFIVRMYNNNQVIYKNSNKTLIRCTDIIGDDVSFIYSIDIYNNSFNGVPTLKTDIFQDIAGVSFNETNFTLFGDRVNNTSDVPTNEYFIRTISSSSNDVRLPFIFINYPIIDTIYYESKVLSDSIRTIKVPDKLDGSEVYNINYTPSTIFTTDYIPNLFKIHTNKKDDFEVMTYTNFKDGEVINHNKTIRRSNFISDESMTNNWRNFPIEGYKLINENKGMITKLIGIGTVLMVHTEHSLFMFNRDASMQTTNKDIMLYQPDAFDIDYQEVFTSNKGFGGLSKNTHGIVDSFGYIFYDSSSNRLYTFDDNKLISLDGDINTWLDNTQPYDVVFANDIENSRLLIMFRIINNNIKTTEVLSYNYDIKTFISKHDYRFSKGIHTKNKLYLIPDVKDDYVFTFDENSKSIISAGIHKFFSDEDILVESNIGIIFNLEYYNIKFVENIEYMMYKRDVINNDDTDINLQNELYSGDELSIYNNNCSTYILKIDNETNPHDVTNYDKPVFELDRWRYNYIRNKISNKDIDFNSNVNTKIYGNYFVFQFNFVNSSDKEFIFEGFRCNISMK